MIEVQNLNLLQKNGIDSQTAKVKYNQNNSIKVEIESIKSSLFDYSDTFTLVTGDIKITTDTDTNVKI